MTIHDSDETDEDRFINAAFDGDFATVQAFLDAGGDIDVAPRWWNAIHHAIENGQVEMITYLLKRGADPDKMCGSWRPLHHAIDAEADRAAQGNEQIRFELTPLLVDGGASVNAPDERGQTPLKMALERGHEEAITLLRDHGAVE